MVEPTTFSQARPLTVERLLAHIDHSNFNAPLGTLAPIDIINEAGQHFVSFHPWEWLVRRPRHLDIRDDIALTTATWTAATRTLTEAGAFTDYVFLQGDHIEITAGTGATLGHYHVESRTDANNIVLATTISAIDLAGPIEAEIVASATIALPADFCDILPDGLRGPDGLALHIEQTTPGALLALRTGLYERASAFYHAAIVWPESVAVGGGEPVPVLELWPTPGTGSEHGLMLMYRAGWQTVTDDNSVVNIPPWCHTALIQLVRTYVLGYSEDDKRSLADRLHEWEQAPYTVAAMERDGGTQNELGILHGGAVESSSRMWWLTAELPGSPA